MLADIKFEGNKSISRSDLLAHIVTAPTSGFFSKTARYYDADLFAIDLKRIVRWYNEKGFYEARIQDVQEQRDDKGRITILVKIEEGSSKREMKAMFGADFLRLRARIDLFDNAVAYVRDDVTVTGINTMLGTRARLGRALVETDDDPNDLHSRRRDATGF